MGAVTLVVSNTTHGHTCLSQGRLQVAARQRAKTEPCQFVCESNPTPSIGMVLVGCIQLTAVQWRGIYSLPPSVDSSVHAFLRSEDFFNA